MMSSYKYCIRGVASTTVILQLVDKVAQLTSSLRPNDENPVSSFLSNPHSCGLPTPINSNHWLTIPAINTVQTYISPMTISAPNMDKCEVKWTYTKSKFTEVITVQYHYCYSTNLRNLIIEVKYNVNKPLELNS